MRTRMSLRDLLFSFEGRITRRTYWYYLLGFGVAWAAAVAFDYAVGGYRPGNGFGCATLGVWFVAILTGAAVGTKRLHDTDRPGAYMLIALIPVIGQIWLLADLGFRKGTVGSNGFGADPLGG